MPQAETTATATNTTVRPYAGGEATPPVEPLSRAAPVEPLSRVASVEPLSSVASISASQTASMSKEQPATLKPQSDWPDGDVRIKVQDHGMYAC